MLGLFFGAGKRSSCFASLCAKFPSAAEHRRLLCKNEKLARSNTFVLGSFCEPITQTKKIRRAKALLIFLVQGTGLEPAC